MSRQDVQTLLDNVKTQTPAVVDDLIPGMLGLAEVQKVLQNLLTERVSIRDLQSILEALGDCAGATKDTDILTEYVRQKLCRNICQQFVSPDNTLTVFTLHPSLEQLLGDSLRQTEMGVRLILEPSMVQKVLNATKIQVEQVAGIGRNPVALCSPRVRPHFRRLVEHSFPMLSVMSYNEIAPNVSVESIGMVSLNDEN
jgi:flagellar biosynthesis protein FlhA